MNWNKYTLDEWLEQFGAWCEDCTMKGGDLPKGLHINQLYWLMQSVEPKRRQSNRICYISDDEAMVVNNLLKKAVRTVPDGGARAIHCLISHKVEGESISKIAHRLGVSKPIVIRWIDCGRYYLLGLELQLEM